MKNTGIGNKTAKIIIFKKQQCIPNVNGEGSKNTKNHKKVILLDTTDGG